MGDLRMPWVEEPEIWEAFCDVIREFPGDNRELKNMCSDNLARHMYRTTQLLDREYGIFRLGFKAALSAKGSQE